MSLLASSGDSGELTMISPPPSPPLSIYELAPIPYPYPYSYPKHRNDNHDRRYYHTRPDRTFSALSTFSTSTLSTVSVTSPSATIESPPTSSYYRRSRSKDLFELSRLSLFAPSASHISASNSTSLQTLRQGIINTRNSTIVTKGPHLYRSTKETSNQMSTTASPPPPPKKPSFFRRLSLSSSAQPIVPPKPTQTPGSSPSHPPLPRKNVLRSASGPYKRSEQEIAGPAYESLPAGAAPSVFLPHDARVSGSGVSGAQVYDGSNGNGQYHGNGNGHDAGLGYGQGNGIPYAQPKAGGSAPSSSSKDRSKSKERNFFSRDRTKTPTSSTPQTPSKDPSHTNSPFISPAQTPIAAQFSRSNLNTSSPQSQHPPDPRGSYFPSPTTNSPQRGAHPASPARVGNVASPARGVNPGSPARGPYSASPARGVDNGSPARGMHVPDRMDEGGRGPVTPSKGNVVADGRRESGMQAGTPNGVGPRRPSKDEIHRQGRASIGPTSIDLPSPPITYEVIASSNSRTPKPRAIPNPSSSPSPLRPHPSSTKPEGPTRSETLSRFEDAEGHVEHLLPNGSPVPISKSPNHQGPIPVEGARPGARPLVSGRRSNSTSRAPRASISRDDQETPRAHPAAVVSPTETRLSNISNGSTPRAIERPPSSYFSKPVTSPMSERQKPIEGVSEASAYARAVAPTLSHPVTTAPQASPPVQKTERRVSRPLPQPPRSGSMQNLAHPPRSASVQSLAQTGKSIVQPPPLTTSLSNMSLAEKKTKQPSPTSPKQISPASPKNTLLIIASNDGTGRRNSSNSIDSVTKRAVVGRKDSSESSKDRRTSVSSDKRRPKIVIPQSETSPTRSNKLALVVEDEKKDLPMMFEFPRSATLPALDDPRDKDPPAPPRHLPESPPPRHPIEKWANEVTLPEGSPKSYIVASPIVPTSLPPRVSSASAQGRRVASSPLASPVFSNNGTFTSSPTQFQSFQPNNRSVSAQSRPPPAYSRQSQMSLPPTQPTMRPRPRGMGAPTLTFIISHPKIAASLLPFLSINSFLSLMGYSDDARKQFTGEMVGRWVMKEWGVQVEKERGRTWPGLTVWEGFLESLLHDPAGYSTYSPQYYALLQHLCLSHTLIVLHLRQLPPSSLPNAAPAFDDEPTHPSLPYSNSIASLSSVGGFFPPRSRVGSTAGSDAGSSAPSRMPRTEKLIEIVMPAPLSSQPQEELNSPPPDLNSRKVKRRGSIGSIASVTSFAFGRKRANSTATGIDSLPSTAVATGPMPQGKAALPPVSFPTAKRYGFRSHGDPNSARSRTSSESGRPGSIFSIQSSPSMSYHQRMSSAYSTRGSFAVDRNAPPVPTFPAGLPMPPPIGGTGSNSGLGSHRASFASTSDAGRSSRRSEHGGNSPVQGRLGTGSPNFRNTPPPRIEIAFEKPPPYTPGRAPILRVFVPLSEKMTRWPSAEGAYFAVKELEKCAAIKRLRLGDLVVNTAIKQPSTTEHVLVFVPTIKHLLVPLEYTHSPSGHIPGYIDAFTLPPSYYYPFLPAPYVVYLNLAPFAIQAQQSMRLAHDRRDVTVASGARLSAKRYLHVAGFMIQKGDKSVQGNPICPEWEGTISLESEGTQEGKFEMEKRFGGGDPRRAVSGPWEVVREKCVGTIWLRLIREDGQRKM